MAHKWVIRRYKEQPISVSENVGLQAKAAWDAGTPVIHLPGNISISNGSISAIEETFETDDTFLELGTGLNTKVEAILDTEGNAVTNWYKMEVGAQEWEKKYAAQPNYYKLIGENNTIWVAVRLIEYSGMYERNPALVRCDEYESEKLYRMKNA